MSPHTSQICYQVASKMIIVVGSDDGGDEGEGTTVITLAGVYTLTLSTCPRAQADSVPLALSGNVGVRAMR